MVHRPKSSSKCVDVASYLSCFMLNISISVLRKALWKRSGLKMKVRRGYTNGGSQYYLFKKEGRGVLWRPGHE